MGVALSTLIFGHPIPRIPSNYPTAKANPDSEVTYAKVQFLISTPAHVTVSAANVPPILPLP